MGVNWEVNGHYNQGTIVSYVVVSNVVHAVIKTGKKLVVIRLSLLKCDQ